MNIKPFLLIAAFVLSTASLNAQKISTDVTLDGLHGRVKNVTKITYEARTDFQGVTSQGDILERLETAYNSKGWRKTMTYVTPEADIIFRSRFKHDGFGLTTLEHIVDNQDRVIGRTYYIYDADHYNITTDNVPTEFIHEHKDQITDYEFIKGTMDDVFLNLTGRKLA